MPDFIVNDNGKQYKITAPDMNAAVGALQQYRKRAPGPPLAGPPEIPKTGQRPLVPGESDTTQALPYQPLPFVGDSAGATVKDVGEQAVASPWSGLAQVAGIPGDLFNATVGALDAGKTYLTGKEYHTDMNDPVGRFMQNLTSRAYRNTAYNLTGATLPEPKTGLGAVTRKAGEFATGAAVLGASPTTMLTRPGIAAADMASNAVKTGVVPGVLSEGTGQFLENVGQPPEVANLARLGVAAGTGGLMSLKPRMVGPTVSALKNNADAILAAAKKEDFTILPSALVRLASKMENTLREAGGSGAPAGKLNPGTDAVMTDIMDAATSGHPMTMNDLERWRRAINLAGKNKLTADPAMAAKMRSDMQDFVDTLPLSDIAASGQQVLAGTNVAQRTAALWKSYRQTYSSMSKGEQIDGLIERAKNSDKWGKGDHAGAIRDSFRTLLNSNEMRFFTKAEQKAIRNATRMSPTEAIASLAGRFSIFGASTKTGIMGMGLAGGAGGYLSGGDPQVVGAMMGLEPMFAQAGQTIANQIAKRDANIASTLARGGRVTPVPRASGLLPFYGSTIYNNGQ